MAGSMTDRWTAVDLHDLFLEAAETERWMPSAKQRVRTTWWPDVQAEWLSYADPETRIRLTPTASQVDRYDLAIDLSAHLEDTDRKLVWAVAFSGARRSRGPQWGKLGRMMGLDRRTVWARYVRALMELSLRLQASGAGAD
jgi:hypothetical protein